MSWHSLEDDRLEAEVRHEIAERQRKRREKETADQATGLIILALAIFFISPGVVLTYSFANLFSVNLDTWHYWVSALVICLGLFVLIRVAVQREIVTGIGAIGAYATCCILVTGVGLLSFFAFDADWPQNAVSAYVPFLIDPATKPSASSALTSLADEAPPKVTRPSATPKLPSTEPKTLEDWLKAGVDYAVKDAGPSRSGRYSLSFTLKFPSGKSVDLPLKGTPDELRRAALPAMLNFYKKVKFDPSTCAKNPKQPYCGAGKMKMEFEAKPL